MSCCAKARIVAAMTLVFGWQTMVAKGENVQAVRNLSDFKCADGRVPDGTDSAHDDTTALAAALNAGPGVVRIGPGYYRVGDVTIPAEVTLEGSGPGTVLRSNGAKSGHIFQQTGGEWALRDVMLDGETKEPPLSVPDHGRCGLWARGCHAFEIRNVTACRFEGIAVDFHATDLQAAAFCNGGTISGLTVYDNYAGVAFSKRAEYITATQIMSYRNCVGCIINAGNVTIGDSHFCMNDVGILLKDEENGSHGGVANCLINHNHRYAILAQDVRNGHNFVGCSVFYATVKLENCRGIKFASGTLACSLIVKGDAVNQFLGNYIDNDESLIKEWDLSPATQFKDNFNDKGPFAGPGAKPPK